MPATRNNANVLLDSRLARLPIPPPPPPCAPPQDAINWGYLALREEDYEWITRQLVKVANATCDGRLVSVLEGGYRIAGRIVSPFGRSVAAHVRALASRSAEVWDTEHERALLVAELQAERRAEEAAVAAAVAAAAARLPAASPRPRLAVLSTGVKPPPLSYTAGGGGFPSSPAPTPVSATVTAARAAALAGVRGGSHPLAAAPPVDAGSAPSGDVELEDGGTDSTGRLRPPSKRRRSAANIDFAALDAQMRLEEEAAKRSRVLVEAVVAGAQPVEAGDSGAVTISVDHRGEDIVMQG